MSRHASSVLPIVPLDQSVRAKAQARNGMGSPKNPSIGSTDPHRHTYRAAGRLDGQPGRSRVAATPATVARTS